ncbi:sigma 54-interacting transcriptional regulator [Guggenheimella bovis]
MKHTNPEIELILNSTHDAMIAIDRSLKITLMNRAAERLVGCKPDTSVGKNVVDVVDNTRLPIVLATGVAELNRRQFIGPIEIITNRMPVYDLNGSIVGAIAVFRDISEISRLATEVTDLRFSLDTLRSLFDAIQDGISVIDTDGHVVLVNDRYKSLAKVSSIRRDRIPNYLGEGELHESVLASGESAKGIKLYLDKLDRHVSIDCSALKIRGELKGSIALIHDLSEIKKLSSDLLQAKSIIRNLDAKHTLDDVLGKNSRMLEAKERAKLCSKHDFPVLLLGEHGTGKELFAHAIHNASDRRFNRFLRLHVGVDDEDRLSQDLFGTKDKPGLLERANGGTLYIDSVDLLPLSIQDRLNIVLNEKMIDGSFPVDVRILAASTRDLMTLVDEGLFRKELYFQLNLFPIRLPNLSERKDDIYLLAMDIVKRLNDKFSKQVTDISKDALLYLTRYDWPGNYRELENVIARAMIKLKVSDKTIRYEHLPPMQSEPQEETLALREYLLQVEREYIEKVLGKCQGNKTQAAKELGISIRSLYYKLEETL